MIVESEHRKIIEIIPKLFSQPFGTCMDGSGLFGSRITEKEEELEKRFSKLRMSEKFFYYLMDGLKQDENIYKERRSKIEKSIHAETLKTPLLLIFEDENFKSAELKTPELYFETYKAIINSKIIETKNFNLETVISIVKSGRSDPSSESRHERINNILHSENLEPYDLVYIYFYLQSDNFFKSMHLFTDKENPLFNWLFHSDLNSQLVDYIFKLKNEESYHLVHRIISDKVPSGIHYISNWEFKNGVELLAWFKVYMHHATFQSVETYTEKNAFAKYPTLKDKFVSYDIHRPEILAMLPNAIKYNLTSANPSGQASSVLNEEKQETTTKVPPVFSFFSRKDSMLNVHFSSFLKPGKVPRKRKPVDSVSKISTESDQSDLHSLKEMIDDPKASTKGGTVLFDSSTKSSLRERPINPETRGDSSKERSLDQMTNFTQSEISFLQNTYRPETFKKQALVSASKKPSVSNVDSSLELDRSSFKRRSLGSQINTHLHKTSVLETANKQEALIEVGLAFTDFPIRNFQPTIDPRSKKTKLFEAEKKQQSSTQESQVFLDYPKKYSQPNINPCLRSDQDLLERKSRGSTTDTSSQSKKHEYPLSGVCTDLMSRKEVAISYDSLPENKYLIQVTFLKPNEEIQVKYPQAFSVGLMTGKETAVSPTKKTVMMPSKGLYSAQKPGISSFFNKKALQKHDPLVKPHKEAPINLMSGKESQLKNNYMNPLLDLSSKSKFDAGFFSDEVYGDFEKEISCFEKYERVQLNLISSEKTESENSKTPLISLDSERTPISFLFQDTNLEKENTFTETNFQHTFRK